MICHSERSEGPPNSVWITRIILCAQRAYVRSLACARDDSADVRVERVLPP
jgi:hypothetical protein